MKTKSKRAYRAKGLELSNLTFKNSQEKTFVKKSVARIAEKIKRMRTERGLSQEAFAEMAGVSISTIKFIEKNQRSPSLPMFFKLLYVLDSKASIWE
jgi:DNA-binding XRE family transcriptional regulator